MLYHIPFVNNNHPICLPLLLICYASHVALFSYETPHGVVELAAQHHHHHTHHAPHRHHHRRQQHQYHYERASCKDQNKTVVVIWRGEEESVEVGMLLTTKKSISLNRSTHHDIWISLEPVKWLHISGRYDHVVPQGGIGWQTWNNSQKTTTWGHCVTQKCPTFVHLSVYAKGHRSQWVNNSLISMAHLRLINEREREFALLLWRASQLSRCCNITGIDEIILQVS